MPRKRVGRKQLKASQSAAAKRLFDALDPARFVEHKPPLPPGVGAEKYRKVRGKRIASIADILVCIRCGERDFYCLEFHHRDPKTKLFTVGQHFNHMAWGRVLEEIAKCDVLCANCHRKLHAVERGRGDR